MTEIKIENVVYHLDFNELSASVISFDKAATEIFIPSTINYEGSTFDVTNIKKKL